MGRRAGQAGRSPRQSPPSHHPAVCPTVMLLLLHLLPAMLPTAALASCSGAGADRQLILAKVRARVLEHLSPPLLQEEPQMEARRVHRRDILENAEVEPEELEDTSQVILFPATGENILMKWRGQKGEAECGFGAMQMLKDGEADVSLWENGKKVCQARTWA